jgi:hypothetical protein
LYFYSSWASQTLNTQKNTQYLKMGCVFVGDLQGNQGNWGSKMTPLEQKYNVKNNIIGN